EKELRDLDHQPGHHQPEEQLGRDWHEQSLDLDAQTLLDVTSGGSQPRMVPRRNEMLESRKPSPRNWTRCTQALRERAAAASAEPEAAIARTSPAYSAMRPMSSIGAHISLASW